MAGIFTGSYNGLSFGNGTSYPLTKLVGFNDMPPVRQADEAKAGDQGYFPGIDYLSYRTLQLGFWLDNLNQAAFDAQCDLVQGAFSIQLADLPLLYTFGDTTQVRQINCRPRKCVIPRVVEYFGQYGEPDIELVAVDPRKYLQTVTSLVTGLAAASGGMTFPATFPLTFGSVGGGGTVNVTNAGNFQTPLKFTISGPVTNPIIDNLTTGMTLSFLITLANTDTLVISQAGTSVCSIVLNGTAGRRSALAVGSAPLSQFGLPGGPPGPCLPGVTQTIRYRNNGAFTGSTMTVSFQSSWI